MKLALGKSDPDTIAAQRLELILPLIPEPVQAAWNALVAAEEAYEQALEEARSRQQFPAEIWDFDITDDINS